MAVITSLGLGRGWPVLSGSGQLLAGFWPVFGRCWPVFGHIICPCAGGCSAIWPVLGANFFVFWPDSFKAVDRAARMRISGPRKPGTTSWLKSRIPREHRNLKIIWNKWNSLVMRRTCVLEQPSSKRNRGSPTRFRIFKEQGRPTCTEHVCLLFLWGSSSRFGRGELSHSQRKDFKTCCECQACRAFKVVNS
jgi:hypothetical protein